MDDIVRQAMRKWPNVPHCFGWLLLDARGNWRMRDERAQHLDRPGDRITHPALLDFINRNYTHDAAGRWYFQNGPQRVYVDLEIAPYIARTDPAAGFLLHTASALPQPTHACLTSEGRLLLIAGEIVAALDDRDLASVLTNVTQEKQPASDAQLLAWLEADRHAALHLHCTGQTLDLQWMEEKNLAARFGFVTHPRA